MELSHFEADNYHMRINSADPVILDVYGNPLGTVNPVTVETDAITPYNNLPVNDYNTYKADTSNSSLWSSLGNQLANAIPSLLNVGANQVKQQVQSYLPGYQQQPVYTAAPATTSNKTLLYVGIGVVFFFMLTMFIIMRKK
jgi:hypothetical protein